MNRRHRTILLTALACLGVVALSGCAAGANNVAQVSAPDQLAGFWLGLWHGVICPITFIVSLFNDKVNIYEVHNSGNWYNFGFVLGVSIIFGGSHGSNAARRRRSPGR